MTALATKHRFTTDEYDRMGKAGVFPPGERVELIDGEIVEMSPIGEAHAAGVKRVNRLFSERLGAKVLLGIQDPIRLGKHSEPQPDVVLLHPRTDFYAGGHPGPKDVFLIVEVSDTTLDYDRDVKIPLYARAGVRESWIADVSGRALEVFRSPGPEGYASVRRLASGDRISPEAFPDVSLAVDDILGLPKI